MVMVMTKSKKREVGFPLAPPSPLKILRNFALFVRETAIGITQTDKALRSFDKIFLETDKFLENPLQGSPFFDKLIGEGLTKLEEQEEFEKPVGYTGETKSYEGQSDASYCAECIVSHWATIYGLLEEADRLSINEPTLNNESINRVKESLKELKASLYDLNITNRPWIDEFKARVRQFRKQYLLPLLAEPNKELLKQAVREAKALYDTAIEVLKTERQLEKEGKVTRSEEEIEADLERQLTYFINKKDIAHLERAYQLAKMTRCSACVKYTAAALDAAREGRMDEAVEWAEGVRRGIRVILNKVE